MKNVFCLLIVSTLLLIGCSNRPKESKVEYQSKAKVLVDTLGSWYNSESGIWETTSWWNGANVLTALIEYGQLTENDSIKLIIESTFNATKQFEVPAYEDQEAWICTNYINDYYDDEAWWALAWIDAWEWTGDKKYLDIATIIFTDISHGWSSECGGGVYWKKETVGKGAKAAISSGLAMLVASRLHLAGVDIINNRSCLQWSIDIWEWLSAVNMVNSKNLVVDGYSVVDGKESHNSRTWTYNQGVVIAGLTEMHKITDNPDYLNSAHKIASATISTLIDSCGVLCETLCEPNKSCSGDADQFKGVFMRHLSSLNSYDPKVEYSTFIKLNANSIWNRATAEGTRAPGVSWSSPLGKSSAATTSSALDALNAAIRTDK